MASPIVAIVGAPNVGKSTLFNRLIGRRRAIVSDRPGVTRDRITDRCELYDRHVTLIDTGGVVTGDPDDIERRVQEEAMKAIGAADLILFVVDARAGLTATDLEVGSMLRESGKPIIPIANKIDSPLSDGLAAEAYRLGLGSAVILSAEHGRGIDELIDRMRQTLPEDYPTAAPERGIPIALIGRPNVGKSSLFNRFVRQDRAMVSPTPGTTRDPIDAVFEFEGNLFRVVDTAGIRRHASTGESVERVSVLKARQALERAELAITLVDGSEPVTHQDATLVGLVLRSRKPVILAVNKIDKLESDAALGERIKEIRAALRFSRHVPIVPVSALTGRGTVSLLTAMTRLRDESRRRYGTTELNAALASMVKEKHPPSDGSRQVRLFYMTQIGISPLRFVIFSNGRKVGATYRRYLEGRLRTRLGLESSPVVLSLRERPSSR